MTVFNRKKKKKQERKEQFVARLRELIAGKSVAQFAREIGMSQQIVNTYVTGQATPRMEFFLRLAEQDVDVNWLLTGIHTEPLADGQSGTVQPTPLNAPLTRRQRIFRCLAIITEEEVEVFERMLEGYVKEKENERRREEAQGS